MYISKYNKFINEIVYLGKTPFSSYSFVSDRESNYGTLDLIMNDGEELKINIEAYGSKKPTSKEFMIDTNHISYREDLNEIIEYIIKILNKNQLGFIFNAESQKTSKYSTQVFYLMNVNKVIHITELEQIINSTKVINKKVKDIDDWDKLIYQTL